MATSSRVSTWVWLAAATLGNALEVRVPSAVAGDDPQQRPRKAKQTKTGPKPSPEYFWATKMHDGQQAGATSVKDLRNAYLAWSYPCITHSTSLIDDKMNVYSLCERPAKVTKFNSSGFIQWQAADILLVANPALWNGSLFFQESSGHFGALDMATGRRVWRTRVAELIMNDFGITSVGEGVVVGGVGYKPAKGQDKVVALDAATGETKWTFKPEESTYNFLGPIKDGRIAFQDATGRVYCLNLTTGALLWKADNQHEGKMEAEKAAMGATLPMTTGGTVLGPNGVLYATSNGGDDRAGTGYLTAFELKTGKRLWSEATSLPAINAPAVGRLPSDGDGSLSVVIGTGANPGGFLNSTYSMLGGSKSRPGEVIAFDARTGKRRYTVALPAWNHTEAFGDTKEFETAPDHFSNAVITGDGVVYLGRMDGLLYRIEDNNKDGQIQSDEVLHFPNLIPSGPRAYQGTVSLAPGMLVVTPVNGMFVFKT